MYIKPKIWQDFCEAEVKKIAFQNISNIISLTGKKTCVVFKFWNAAKLILLSLTIAPQTKG